MPDQQNQRFVKRAFQSVFTEHPPRLLYISHRLPNRNEHPRLLHAHEGLAEVMLVRSGSARFLIGEKIHEIGPGDLIICNSGVVHDELSIEEDLDLYCLACAGLRLPGLREEALIPDDAETVCSAGAETEELCALLDMMYDQTHQQINRVKAGQDALEGSSQTIHQVQDLFGCVDTFGKPPALPQLCSDQADHHIRYIQDQQLLDVHRLRS